MIDRFQNNIRQLHLFENSDRILLAVSGGVDSMVMWNLFEESGFIYAVIHCNFQLRGKESDEDEKLVRGRADELGVQLFVRRFDTLEHAEASGISVEMAARELRYDWFEEIRLKYSFQYLATAHHQDDLLETFFINLLRKTGIRGLTGIRVKTGTLIRPLLFTNRMEIEAWARLKKIPFRDDATNEETIFRRNFIRHKIIPELEKLNPSFRSGLAGTMKNLRLTGEFYLTEIDRYINKITVRESENPEVYISRLLKLPHPETVLYEWMSRYGFNASTAESLYSNLVKEPGRQYFSKTHRLVIDRNKLIITLLREEKQMIFYLEANDLKVHSPVILTVEWKKAPEFKLIRHPAVACLDAGKLVFPLVIRKWQAGEYFQPLGMSGFKKISDFFVDEKFSLPEKEASWILYSENKVVWIIGHRIDNRFRITPETKDVLVLRVNM